MLFHFQYEQLSGGGIQKHAHSSGEILGMGVDGGGRGGRCEDGDGNEKMKQKDRSGERELEEKRRRNRDENVDGTFRLVSSVGGRYQSDARSEERRAE